MKRLARILFAIILLLISFSIRADAAQYSDPAFGYSFAYPDTWHALKGANEPNVVVLRNFPDDQSLQLGNVPFGGAQITLIVYPPYAPGWSADTDEYAELHAVAARVGTILSETTRASGTPARVKSTRATASATTNTSIWTLLRLRGRMFKMGMEYQTADPAGLQYEQIFSDLLASLSASGKAPTPSVAPTP